MIEMDSRYHVGDRVRIVSDYLKPEDDGLIGFEHEIKSVRWCELCNRYEYRIKRGGLLWCDNDFEFDTQIELPEFSASEISLNDFFSE